MKILDEIYGQYYDKFVRFSKDNPSRSSKIYVPIEIDAIAKTLDVNGDIIFGRLYYHLDKKYGYRKDDNSLVHFFAMVVGNDKHCINFPLAASVLADLRKESKKFWIATNIALVSLVISISSLIISLLV